MERNHSPGPWRMGGHPGGNAGTAWREILGPSQFGPVHIGQALEDDARIMAAAPDMLAALREAESIMAYLFPGAVIKPGSSRDIIRAAIAKAEGR